MAEADFRKYAPFLEPGKWERFWDRADLDRFLKYTVKIIVGTGRFPR